MLNIKRYIKVTIYLLIFGIFLIGCSNNSTEIKNKVDEGIINIETALNTDKTDNKSQLSIYKLSNTESEEFEYYLKKENIVDAEKIDIKKMIAEDLLVYRLSENNKYLFIIPTEKDSEATELLEATVLILKGIDDFENVESDGLYTGKMIASLKKTKVQMEDDSLEIWSQYENMTKEVVTTFNYVDEKLEWASQLIEDPTLIYYDNMIKLLRNSEIEKAMELDRNLEYIYNYQDKYFKTGTMAIRMTHDYAYQTYRNDSLSEADKIKMSLDALTWGINKYLKTQIDMEKLTVENINDLDKLFEELGYRDKYKIGKAEFAAILNDYAYFKFEQGFYKESQIYLEKVLQYDKMRTVAHINMGDALYEQGFKEEAKEYYAKYVEILGADNPVIPERVFERINE